MRLEILFALMLMTVSTAAFANDQEDEKLECPEGMKTAYLCSKADQAGDHEVAIGMVENAAVCEASKGTKKKFYLIATGPVVTGDEPVLPAKVTARPGATTYASKLKIEKDTMTLSLIKKVVSPRERSNATFEIKLPTGETISRSLKCL